MRKSVDSLCMWLWQYCGQLGNLYTRQIWSKLGLRKTTEVFRASYTSFPTTFHIVFSGLASVKSRLSLLPTPFITMSTKLNLIFIKDLY